MNWQNVLNNPTRKYKCGYCGQFIASKEGYPTTDGGNYFIYICHNCGKPTFFDNSGVQTPGSIFGDDVASI
ncbi:MAG: hypothetical protein M3R52_08655, partial [Acidobacteriota bacterium]|nr:hypothetical protein [Acidobacteriota bacterium]